MISPIIDSAELSELINKNDIILIDARTGANAFELYKAGHLEGALHVDLEKDLSEKGQDAESGGRHPLPEPKSFALLLQRLGIKPESHVIVYDDKNGVNAGARFWWMMKAAGHVNVQVVDGGMDAAIAAGFPLGTSIPQTAQSSYSINKWMRPIATIDEVAIACQDEHQLVIDVRDAYRYRGESEPLDPVAGHIPGAVNIPLTGNLDTKGKFLSPEELFLYYKRAIGSRDIENVIVHCGSGVTACHTLLALERAEIVGAKLYVGSWSEWCRSGRPIQTGSDPI